MHDAGPSSQCQQFRSQIVRPLIIGHTELGKGILNGTECITSRVVIVGDDTRKRSCPGTALLCQRGAIDLQEATMDAAAPLGHGPMRKTLIQIAGQKSNHRWMDPRISIDTANDVQPVAMPNRD